MGRNYAFTVTDVAEYSTGFYVFMDIDSMRDLFGEADSYYNVVFSDKELDIPAGRLHNTTSRQELVQSSGVFVEMMMPMVVMMVSVSVLIFCVVMYPYMVSNVACGMNVKFDWQLYVLIFATVILVYLVINQLLVYKINKIQPTEVLKNRE